MLFHVVLISKGGNKAYYYYLQAVLCQTYLQTRLLSDVQLTAFHVDRLLLFSFYIYFPTLGHI